MCTGVTVMNVQNNWIIAVKLERFKHGCSRQGLQQRHWFLNFYVQCMTLATIPQFIQNRKSKSASQLFILFKQITLWQSSLSPCGQWHKSFAAVISNKTSYNLRNCTIADVNHIQTISDWELTSYQYFPWFTKKKTLVPIHSVLWHCWLDDR